MDYTDNNGLIDFSGDVNKQLSDLIGLTDDEVSYIEKVIAAKDK